MDEGFFDHERHEQHEQHQQKQYNQILFKDEVYAIQGAVYEVNKVMGCGFLETVYQECLEREFILRKIPYEPQKRIQISYKEMPLSQIFAPDFICYGSIILDVKAINELTPRHTAQLMNYLRATSMKLGLLINFGAYPKTQIKRVAY
jgi:GxxExxY protein